MKGKCLFSHPIGGEEVDGKSDNIEKDLEAFGYSPALHSDVRKS